MWILKIPFFKKEKRMNNKVLVLVLMSDRVESRKWNMIQSVLQTFRARTLFRRSIFKLFLTNVSLESLDSKKKNWSEVLNRVIHHFFQTIFSKLKMRQPFWISFRTLNPKFQKNWTKTEAAPALPCLAGEPPKLADRLCSAASICF